MRAVVQRVTRAQVLIDGQVISKISRGLLVLVGIGIDDTNSAADYLAQKIVDLRIFEDSAGKMNLSLKDINGQLLVVSQFTLYGDCRKGKRPSFSSAARPETASEIYNYLIDKFHKLGVSKVQTGVFAAHMEVELVNDGPVTILLDSDKKF
ncbi:D-aminoacyl-tRNA deacylase [Desulfallas thermosapovorans]|uniref:D-aminoacyl-tRNA deacylase n=1 Tax=Desulfallas thermosapovorans DSM 6562 TaxID=1121431 RepID=A0A5S4ZVN2_9FIRM|nr:D-aminoacyl-tRNA deacylase [Desulfallas thermosapovorans]TYO96972.1 D-tyrosyl-tRNA(Tyr) deacylase [Desulfallas thermosapovorans DSM 6562]